jgi:hypothetical protein
MRNFFKRAAIVGTLIASMVGSALSAAPAAAASGSATLSFNPSSSSFAVGATFSVPVAINVTGGNTNGVQFGVTYDPNVLTLNSASDGTYFSSYASGISGCSEFNQPWGPSSTAGASTVGADSLLGTSCGAGPTGSGTMATFNFTAKAGVNALTALNFTALSQTGTVVSGVSTTTLTPITLTIGTPPAPKLAVTGASTAAVSGTPTEFNVSYAVANNGTAAADNSTHTLTVTVVSGSTTLSTDTFTLPLAVGASTSTKTDGPFTLSGSLETITITADPSGSAGGPATATTAYQYSALSSSGNTQITATYGAFITLTAPANITSFTLTPGTNQDPDGNLGVAANVNFQVTADGTNNGHFAEYNGTAFVSGGPSLLNALVIQPNNASAQDLTLSGTPQNLVAGTVAAEPSTGYQFPIDFIQTVGDNDVPVNAPNVYYQVVTFNAAGSF